MPPPQTVFTFS